MDFENFNLHDIFSKHNQVTFLEEDQQQMPLTTLAYSGIWMKYPTNVPRMKSSFFFKYISCQRVSFYKIKKSQSKFVFIYVKSMRCNNPLSEKPEFGSFEAIKFWRWPLHENCPNTKFFLVRIFLHLKWLRRFPP